MRTTMPLAGKLCLGAALALLCGATVFAAGVIPPGQRGTRANMMLSDTSLPPLHLRSHVVNAEITGRTVRVAAESVYHNDTSRDLEATYIFPLPEGATVERFVMWMDGQPVEGKVAEKNRARSTYEGIVSKRKDPGLVEQIGENLFRYRIYPVRAGQDQRIRMEYSQVLPLSAEGTAVHFSYPLYTPNARESTTTGAKEFVLSVAMEMESAIESIVSPSHKISARVFKDNPRKGTAAIEEMFSALDRDFDLKIVLKEKASPVTALAFRPAPEAGERQEEGTLMLFITPQLPANETLPGKDVVMVMDTSGSMAGQKIEQARAALSECLQRLRPSDRFAIVAFSDVIRTMDDTWRDCTSVNIAQAENFIRSLQEGGATNIEEALQRALSFPAQEGRLRQILFATDGLPTAGISNTEDLVRLATPKDPKATGRFFTFGIGYDVNTVLLDKIAATTSGDRAYVKENERIDRKIATLCDKIGAPVLTEVTLEFSGILGVEQMYPPKAGDLYLGRQCVITARYRTPGKGQVVLRGKRGGKEIAIEAALDLPEKSAQATSHLPKQWAVRKVGFLLDQMRLNGENTELRDEVVRLGTKYSIVTPYTSYLALEAPDRARFDAETKQLQAQRLAAQQPPAGTPALPAAPQPRFALASKHDAPPSDPTSRDASDIVVPPDILAKAEIGDHFETRNPDRPDTHSTFGNADAHIFHSVRANDMAGGGGTEGESIEDLIGVGGGASPGTGGGWGGAGTGVDSGSGRGVFGSRNGGGRRLMVMRHGGSRATESGVDAALRWLANHQEADGHFDSQKYGTDAKTDTAVTSLALLAFLGAGHTEKIGDYKGNVQRAVAWLKSKQNAEGRVFDETDRRPVAQSLFAPEALATMALAEAAGMANIPDTKAAAQKAISYCTDIHQVGEARDKSGWGFDPKSNANIVATAWFVMALKSAKVAGLHVDPNAFDGAIKFLDSVEHKSADGTGSVYWFRPNEERSEAVHIHSAMGTLSRQFMGWKREDLALTVEACVIRGGGFPNSGGTRETSRLCFWYFETLSAFQQGGDLWKRWNEGLRAALVDDQAKQGDDAGSWPAANGQAQEWGRVGQTAFGCLCLEVYYIYLAPQPGAGTTQATPAAPAAPPARSAVNMPRAESGKDAVDYSEFIRRLQNGNDER